jgi:hypothetical protein
MDSPKDDLWREHVDILEVDLFETVTPFRQNDRAGRGDVWRLVALVAVLLTPFVVSNSARASGLKDMKIAEVGLTERVVTDHISGIALLGYDPVSYFTDGAPRIGKPEFEIIWQGAAWRFSNEGNLAAFVADPNVYAPQYGGYDPNSVARGVAAAGDPIVYAVVEGRVFLFRDEASRRAFLDAPETLEASAAAWPKVEKTLIR